MPTGFLHRAFFLAVTTAAMTGVIQARWQQAAPRPPAPAGQVRDPTGGRGPAVRTGTAGITGTVVVAATGQPAGGARVMVSAPDLPGGRSTTTDNQGRFTIGSLPAGRYFLSVSKPGHVSATYGQRRPRGPGASILLADGETHSVAIQLPRGGVITGTVLDERGDPSINTYVRGMRFMLVNGQRRLQQTGSGGTTDDRGIYRLHSLEPGDYVVCASARGMSNMTDAQRMQMEIDGMRRSLENVAGANAAAAQRMQEQMTARIAALQAQLPAQTEPVTGYAPVCYPGTGSAATTSIPIGPGDERGGVDFQLQLTPMARIEGTVIGGTGTTASAQNVQISLVNIDETTVSVDTQGTHLDPSGRFRFMNIAPGTYRLLVRSTQGASVPIAGPQGGGPQTRLLAGGKAPEPKLWAVTDITVAGQDITNIALEMQRGLSVSGHLVFQGTTGLQAPQDFSRLLVSAQPMPAFPPGAQLATSAQVSADASGRFTIPDVLPGRYRLVATSGVPGWTLDSVMVGAQDALDQPLEVKPGQNLSGAVLTFTDRPTELSGLIVNEKGEPALNHTILLYSADEKHWTPESRRIRTARASADGKFTFRAMPSGDYRLTALLDAEPGAWFDPAFLEALGTTSLRISLGEGEKKVQNFRVSEGQ